MSKKNSASPSAPLDLTREQLEVYLARGRRARSEAILGGLARGFAALRRRFERDEQAAAGAYRLTWKAR